MHKAMKPKEFRVFDENQMDMVNESDLIVDVARPGLVRVYVQESGGSQTCVNIPHDQIPTLCEVLLKAARKAKG